MSPQGTSSQVTIKGVLILVLMEYGLRVGLDDPRSFTRVVLILVLMEYGLRGSNL